MFKKSLAALVLLVFLGVLAGCASTSDRPTDDDGGLWGAIMRMDQWVKDHAW